METSTNQNNEGKKPKKQKKNKKIKKNLKQTENKIENEFKEETIKNEIDNSQSDENNFQIISEAWPVEARQQIKVRSKIHNVLQQEADRIQESLPSSDKPKEIRKQILNQMMEGSYFRKLEQSDMVCMQELHQEWFPLEYPQEFYQKILTMKKVIALGCFINIDGKEIMLGSIISQVRSGNRDVVQIYQKYKYEKFVRNSYINQILYLITCRQYSNYSKSSQEIQGCYVMTLGVVDELRGYGLGTLLLQRTYKVLRKKYLDCKIMYLHIVEYNDSGFLFYNKRNGFEVLKKDQNYYDIQNKQYDALLLYKILKKKN